jgi:SWI/SNF-related matrix-associated actin-dependent regulator 1 of chromatin subfamily A
MSEIQQQLAIAKTKLRPYQVDGLIQMAKRDRNLEFDDMGLGKTLQTLISSIDKLCTMGFDLDETYPHGWRILIMCSKNALYVWKEEIQKWFHAESVIYTGTPIKRSKLAQKFFASDCHFLITTYGVADELPRDKWNTLICDEIHAAGLLNHKTKTYKMVEDYCKWIKYLYLLTGTPIRQGVVDLYAPLHLVDPKRFKNYWQFVNTYCIVTDTPFGKQIERNPRNIAGFRNLLQNYMVRRMKTEVLHDLPGKQRNVIPLEMTPKQSRAHQEIMEELCYIDDDTAILTPNKMTAILRARQLLVTPRLLGIDEDGAGFEYIKEAGEALLRGGRPFVVFTAFREALPLLADLINEMGLGTKQYLIHGGMTPAAFANSWQGFEKDPSKNKVMLAVIKSGASFHATTAADSFFIGYEWDFNLNTQSEDRLCRLGQENFVNCNYLLYNGNAVDSSVKDRLNEKQDSANWIIGTEEQYQLMLQKVGPRKRKA